MGGLLSSVEVFDLKHPSSTCNRLMDFPIQETGMALGIIDDKIRACGGSTDTNECYDYNPATGFWSHNDDMIRRRSYPRASIVSDIWLVSGDGNGSDDNGKSTEMWTGNEFEQAPPLPVEMQYLCQLTINSTHVFFVNGVDDDPAYLLNWDTKQWTELLPMNEYHYYPSCGLINNPENGLEVVVVENGETEIFNFNDLTWRAGPVVDYVDHAGFAQLENTFVVVGGVDSNNDVTDTIFLFDHINYDWILHSQRLATPRDSYPGVLAVPDDFVSCN